MHQIDVKINLDVKISRFLRRKKIKTTQVHRFHDRYKRLS